MMRKFNFWKTLAFSVMALTAFAGCSDSDDEGGNTGIPSITVNEVASTSVGVTLEGGSTAAIAVVSNGTWTLSMMPTDASSWITPSAMSGSGASSLTFNVAAATVAREATITLTATGSVSGYPITKTATILIKQSEGGASGVALYEENCGTEVSKVGDYWPYVSAFAGWTRGGSLGQTTVEYPGEGASVRNSGKDYDPSADEKPQVSGAPYVSLKTAFDINKINIGTNDNFTFTFTAQNTLSTLEGSPYTPTFGDVTAATLNFAVSTNGTTYAKVPFTATKIGTGSWYLCKAEFKLPAGTSVSAINVRMDGFTGGANLRIDDFRLSAGGNGAELGGGEQPGGGTVTIGSITAAGNYEVKNALVVAASPIAYIIQDATGSMVVYARDNGRTVGEKINISGAVTIYNATSVPQFTADAAVSVVSSGNAVAYAPTTYDLAKVEAYLTNIKCLDIAIAGKLVKDGNYYNLELPGSTTLQGSIQYYTPDAALDGRNVTVKGFAVGTSKSGPITRIKVMPYEIIPSSDPAITGTPESVAFTAAGEAKTVAFTAANVGSGNKVYAKITGADASQFSVATGAATSPVTVTAAANATTDSKSATLTIYIAASEGAAAIASATVPLTQAGKLPDGAKTVDIDLTAKGYANAQEITTVAQTPITLTFAKGSAPSNVPKYYTSGTAVRMYAGNTLTVSGATITKIEYTIGDENNNFSTVSVGTYTGAEWVGSANNIVFTSNPEKVNNKFLQTRIQKVKITYTE
ncbi:MAG: BACON domain-containing carbohydrate-binding protein [Alistipes sp.]